MLVEQKFEELPEEVEKRGVIGRSDRRLHWENRKSHEDAMHSSADLEKKERKLRLARSVAAFRLDTELSASPSGGIRLIFFVLLV